jgi:hypothetical protein
MKVEIIGVYPVEAPEPCHLIEAWFRNIAGELDFGDMMQELPDHPKSNWQVLWDEHILNATGSGGDLAPFPNPINSVGDIRVAFFFHYLDFSKPLLTPAGPIDLPKPQPRPDRLTFIEYESPC